MNYVFIAILLATALAAIEGTIVATAIPSITADLDGVELISWIYSAYLLTSAIAAILFGKLADLFGRKKMIIIGITLFAFGSLLCGLAQNMTMLIVFRAIQGIGAGSILPITLTMVSELFDTEKGRARGQSYISMVWGVAGVIGPLIGGFLIDVFTWHYIFLLNVPFAIGSVYFIARYYEEQRTVTKHKIDYAGAALFATGTFALMYAIITGSNTGQWWTQQQVLCYVAMLVCFVAFIAVELRVSEPLIPLQLFKNRRLMTINALSFCTMAIVIGMSAYVPLYAQTVLGKNATVAGLMLTPLSLMWTLGAMGIGLFIGKMANKYFIVSGTVLLMVGTLMMAQLTNETSELFIVCATALTGLGMGFIAPLLIITLQKTVAKEHVGLATGLNSFTNTFSQSLGAAIYGVIFNVIAVAGVTASQSASATAPAMFATGIQAVYIGTVVFAIIAFVLALTIKKDPVNT